MTLTYFTKGKIRTFQKESFITNDLIQFKTPIEEMKYIFQFKLFTGAFCV